MNYDKPKRIKAKSSAEWYRRLYSTVDTYITSDEWYKPTDDPEVFAYKKQVINEKRQKQLNRMLAIKEVVTSPGFHYIEDVMMNMVDHIDKVKIWDAINELNDNKLSKSTNDIMAGIMKLAGERQAIIDIFDVYANIDQHIATLQQAIKKSASDDLMYCEQWMQYVTMNTDEPTSSE